MSDFLKEIMRRNQMDSMKSMMESFDTIGPIVSPQHMSVERIDTTGMLIRDMKEISALLKEYGEFLDVDAKESLNETICELSKQIGKLAQNASFPMFKVSP